MKKIITFTILLSIVFCIESCGSKKKEGKVKNVDTDVMSDYKVNSEQVINEFNFDNWLADECLKYTVPTEKEDIIIKSFDTFEKRLVEYVNDRIVYSKAFLKDEKDYYEFVDNLVIGYVSMKSLEQIINFEILEYNGKNQKEPMQSIELNYMSKENVLAIQSISNIDNYYKTIDVKEIKNKEKKRLYLNYVKNEILRNYSIELSKQKFFNKF